MNDKELLEFAAQAAEIELYFSDNGVAWVDGDKYVWNPLSDDGDALRLAVRLRLLWDEMELFDLHFDPESPDLYAATRRAIVCAAAEIGKAKAN
jgi:hypothetical protein